MGILLGNLNRLLLSSSFAFLPLISFAQNQACDPGKEICNPINATSIDQVIQTFLEGALKVGIPIIALAIIYCGFLFVAARGNSEKLSKAKDALLYTVIGAAILLGSWGIAQVVSETIQAL